MLSEKARNTNTIVLCNIQVYLLIDPCGNHLKFIINSKDLLITEDGPSDTLPSFYYSHTNIQTTNISYGTTIIGDYSFYQFTNIGNIYFLETEIAILNSAFQSCSNLLTVTMP